MLPLKYTPYCLLQVVVSTLPWRQHTIYQATLSSPNPNIFPALPFPSPCAGPIAPITPMALPWTAQCRFRPSSGQ